MIKAIISDFSRVVLLPNDETYTGGLNLLHKELSANGKYDFWQYFRLNQDLINFYKSVCKRVDIYIFTKGYVQELPVLQPVISEVFKGVFSASRLELNKNSKEAYILIAGMIKQKPEEILYIDDNQDNVDAAKKAGLNAICYNSNKQVINRINMELNK
ncbi:MAG: HAD-IA family hydrolase [Patescibacteria group bacterium]